MCAPNTNLSAGNNVPAPGNLTHSGTLVNVHSAGSKIIIKAGFNGDKRRFLLPGTSSRYLEATCDASKWIIQTNSVIANFAACGVNNCASAPSATAVVLNLDDK